MPAVGLCPKCQKLHPASVAICPEDGTVPVPPERETLEESLSIGDPVAEYVIQGVLGSGSFGSVYSAVHPLIGKQVAIKILSHRFSADPSTVSRFVSEARAVNQIRHRNVVDIFAFGTLPDGRHYHVMELLEGFTLGEHLRRTGRLSLLESLSILRPLASALDAAHEAGIAHRDLKPENVFLVLGDDGRLVPKLLDFGVAKLLSEELPREHETARGTAVGTPAYMSPEQCKGPDVDHRTDVYAFGVLSYELITGTLPFTGTNNVELMMKQLNDSPEPPSRRVPGIPAELDGVLLSMMAKNPSERPASLKVAVEALEKAVMDHAGATMHDPSAAIQTLPSESPGLRVRRGIRATKLRRIALGVILLMSLGLMALRFLAPLRGRNRAQASAGDVGSAAGATGASLGSGQESQGQPIIQITVEGAPEGTRVLGPGGDLLPTDPGRFELPRSEGKVALTFRAPGYESRVVEVDASDDRTIVLSLKPLPPPRPGRPILNQPIPEEDEVEEPEF